MALSSGCGISISGSPTIFTFERGILAIVGAVSLYFVWGPLPVGEPGYPGSGFRWGLFGYYEPEYLIYHSHFNSGMAAAAAAAYAEKWKPGMPVGLCGTPFVETTFEPRGGIDPPMLACSVTVLGFAAAWLCLRRPLS